MTKKKKSGCGCNDCRSNDIGVPRHSKPCGCKKKQVSKSIPEGPFVSPYTTGNWYIVQDIKGKDVVTVVVRDGQQPKDGYVFPNKREALAWLKDNGYTRKSLNSNSGTAGGYTIDPTSNYVGKSKCPKCGSNTSNGECSECGWFGDVGKNTTKTIAKAGEFGGKILKVTGIKGGRGRFDGCTDTAQMAALLKPGEKLSKRTYGGGTQIEVRGPANSTSLYGGHGSSGLICTAQVVEEKTLGNKTKGDRVVDNKGGYKVVQFHDGYQTMYKVVSPSGKTLDEFESLSVATKYAENMRNMKSLNGNTYMKTPNKKKPVVANTKGKKPTKKKSVEDTPDIAEDNNDPAEDTSTPFNHMPGAKVIASLHSHAKSEHDYLNDELSKMDNPGAREDLEKYLGKHVEPRMEHLNSMLGKHYPDHDMDDTIKALESDGTTTDNYAEESMVDEGEVPPDTVDPVEPDDDDDNIEEGAEDVPSPSEEDVVEDITNEETPTDVEVDESEEESKGVPDDTTEEILERYKEPKSNKWSTRKIGTLHRLKDGRTYLVREKTPTKPIKKKDLDNPTAMPDEMDMSLDNQGNPSEITPDHHETIGKAADHMEALADAPDLPKHHCAGLSHHASKLKELVSNLQSQGNPAEDGGVGDGMMDEGNPVETKEVDEEEEEIPTNKSLKKLSTPLVKKFDDFSRRFELLTGIKVNGN